jgi:hypothetical protein
MRKNSGGLPVEFKDLINRFPAAEDLLAKHPVGDEMPEVNGHLHSPYSFCAFDSIGQMFAMAREEGLTALGINDFFTVDGYSEFEKNALENRIFPLFNIEFMGLMKDLQEQDIRVNDPNNPGRVYFSGKALRYPLGISAGNNRFLAGIQENSLKQVREMCSKTNLLLEEIGAPFTLPYEYIREKYAENLVRERHIARALREACYEHYNSEGERLGFFKKLFAGKEMGASLDSVADVENEIRSVILKKGGRAFVPEDGDAFPDLERIISFILDAGGIPCYPVLLDDRKGNITSFEGDWDRMDQVLQGLGVACLELIPARNSLAKLKEFTDFFLQKQYVISYGTEHNAPELFPVTVKVEGKRDLPGRLKDVSFKGAAVFAAHQYLVARGEEGFVKPDGSSNNDRIEYFQDLGHAVIREFNQNPRS